MNDAVMKAQGYAVSIESDIRRVLGCERFGFAGIADSDFIRRNPLAAVLATCGYIYAQVNNSDRKLVEKFVMDTTFYWEMTLDELLSFETSHKTIGMFTKEIEYEDGEEALKDIIDKFNDICSLIA